MKVAVDIEQVSDSDSSSDESTDDNNGKATTTIGTAAAERGDVQGEEEVEGCEVEGCDSELFPFPRILLVLSCASCPLVGRLFSLLGSGIWIYVLVILYPNSDIHPRQAPLDNMPFYLWGVGMTLMNIYGHVWMQTVQKSFGSKGARQHWAVVLQLTGRGDALMWQRWLRRTLPLMSFVWMAFWMVSLMPITYSFVADTLAVFRGGAAPFAMNIAVSVLANASLMPMMYSMMLVLCVMYIANSGHSEHLKDMQMRLPDLMQRAALARQQGDWREAREDLEEQISQLESEKQELMQQTISFVMGGVQATLAMMVMWIFINVRVVMSQDVSIDLWLHSHMSQMIGIPLFPIIPMWRILGGFFALGFVPITLATLGLLVSVGQQYEQLVAVLFSTGMFAASRDVLGAADMMVKRYTSADSKLEATLCFTVAGFPINRRVVSRVSGTVLIGFLAIISQIVYGGIDLNNFN